MNAIRSVNPRRLVVFGLLIVVASVALLFWARDLVRELIVLPISYWIYVIRLVLRTAPQQFFWWALIFISFLVAYRSVTARRRGPVMPMPSEMFEAAYSDDRNAGRVAFWATKVNLLRRSSSNYYLSGFQQSICRLLIDVIAYRYHLTGVQVEQRIQDGTMDIPDDVRAYLLTGLRGLQPPPGNLFTRLLDRFLSTARRWFSRHSGETGQEHHSGLSNEDELLTRRVIAYIEDELEVLHDRTSD